MRAALRLQDSPANVRSTKAIDLADACVRMNTRELDRTLFTGIAWTAGLRWIGQLVSWCATLYAVRVLTPGDYGLVAMAAIPIGFARLVENFGLESVVLQDRTLANEQVARLAGLGIVLSLGLISIFAVASPVLAGFFHEPTLRPMIIALSITFLFDALQIVPRALLQRDLQFQQLAVVNFVQVCASATVLVVAAGAGFGPWSLIANTIVGALVTLILVLRLRPYAVAIPRQVASLLRPLMAGWRVLVAHTAWYGYSNADSAIVGRILGKDDAGIFSIALVLANVPTQEMASVMGRVVPGVFTRSQSDQELLRRYFLLLTEGLSYLALPIATGIALTADTIVAVLFGEQWLAATGPLRILCAYVAFHVMQMLAPHVIMWTGHFRAIMWLNLFALAIMPPAFLVGIQWGLEGVAWAWVVAYPIAMLPGLILNHRLLGIGWLRFLSPMRPAAIACVAMMATVLLAEDLLHMEEWANEGQLAAQAILGAATYVALLALMFRERVMRVIAVIRGTELEPIAGHA
jgi:teichuronic acid exporter